MHARRALAGLRFPVQLHAGGSAEFMTRETWRERKMGEEDAAFVRCCKEGRIMGLTRRRHCRTLQANLKWADFWCCNRNKNGAVGAPGQAAPAGRAAPGGNGAAAQKTQNRKWPLQYRVVWVRVFIFTLSVSLWRFYLRRAGRLHGYPARKKKSVRC